MRATKSNLSATKEEQEKGFIEDIKDNWNEADIRGHSQIEHSIPNVDNIFGQSDV